MEVFDLNQRVANKKVEAGTILILQGQSEKAITMVHSGMAELLSCESDIEGMSPDEVIKSSVRVGLIKGESVCGVVGLRSPRPSYTSVLTVTDCIITNLPVSVENLIQSLQSRIRLNLRVLRALVQRIESAVFLFKNYKYLWHKLASIQDSIALATTTHEAFEIKSDQTRYNMSLSQYSEYLRKLGSDKNLPLSEPWDHNLFLGRLQQDLGLYNEEDLLRPEAVIDYQQFVFFKRLVKKSDKILANLFYQDEPSNYYTFQFLGKAMEQLLDLNKSMVLNIKSLMGILYSAGGWVEQILALDGDDENKKNIFDHFMAKFTWHCRKDIQQLLGYDPAEQFDIYKDLVKLKSAPVVTEAKASKDVPVVKTDQALGQGLAKYKNLLKRILDFAEVSDEFRETFTELTYKIKALKDRYSMDKEPIELRKEFSAMYWELYEICFFKVLGSDLKSFIPGIMLHFGLIDEDFLTKEDLEFLDQAYSKELFVDHDIPVMTLPYFLEKVYKDEVMPSMDDMGDSFRDRLKRQERFTKKETEAEIIYRNTAEDKVRYEIEKIVANVQPLLFGNRRRSLPILCSQGFLGKSERLFQEPEEVSQRFNEVRTRDFSVFFREVVAHSKFGSDVIKMEVLPNIVLYPTIGERMMMWQELDGRKRSTQGRFFLPLYFNGKLESSILELLGAFRWEMSKTIAGAKWTDPVEGGLVGYYYDYINFYQKHPKLSLTVKEEIKALVKKTRSDKERFIKDYQTWIENEYEGRVKLNAANREIFYKFCPFPKEVREVLAKKPLYTSLENRYVNNTRKAMLRMDSKRKRFEKAGIPLPEDLELYIKYLEQ
ncbi:hypothetical protein [Spirochaeta cellobiosiphila]|uniref:hypothetical protein n=1 Tax=Spirochaeta cellobiosiphila TaxID=504483 RepID=UPI0004070A0F|nr:hypothetical protein [Spirochaeta cellobiosiphila]